MATTFVRPGDQVNIPTAVGLVSNDPFVYGNFGPCLLLIDADAASPYNATVKFSGIATFSVAAINDSGNSAVAEGDQIFWTAGDTPQLSKKSSGKPFGIAFQEITSGATATIEVKIRETYVAGGSITNAQLSGGVQQNKLDRRFVYEDFKTPIVTAKAGGGAAGGTAGDTNVMHTGYGNAFEYFVTGTQTITAPVVQADGALISLDLNENDGVEYTLGITARSNFAFTVGTDPAFYMKAGFKIADVSGTDEFAVGFRKAEAYKAATALDDYDEMACFNKQAENIYIETILNGGGTVSTDTQDNWADGETHTFEIRVSAAGVVTYLIDDAAPTATAAFTFDDGEVVIPFALLLHDATTPGAIHWTEFKCGLM